MIKDSQGWKELQVRRERLKTGQNILRLLKIGIDFEAKEIQKKFPKCKCCAGRFEGDKDGSYNKAGEFYCNKCMSEYAED